MILHSEYPKKLAKNSLQSNTTFTMRSSSILSTGGQNLFAIRPLMTKLPLSFSFLVLCIHLFIDLCNIMEFLLRDCIESINLSVFSSVL